MSRKGFINILPYGACLGLLSVLIVWGKYQLLIVDYAAELYALLVGVVFIAVGAWLGRKLTKPKTIIKQEVVIREVPVPTPAESKLFISENNNEKAGISQRELDVLQLLAKGLSNEEIAGRLFVSQNTVKTHLSNLYFKLDVKRRTQAVEKARSMGLIG
jgi:DNA-binding CsgD family transcriptional regulator